MMQSTKVKEVGDLEWFFTSDTEVQSLEFSQLVFGPPLRQYFLTCFLSLYLVMVMYVLSHCMLELRDLFFVFDFAGDDN